MYKPMLKEALGDRYLDDLTINESDILIKSVKDQINQELDKFKKIFEPIELNPYPYRNIVINKYFIPLCNNEYVRDIARIALLIREDERRGGKGGQMEYKLPKRIFNMEEVRNNPDIVDQILNNSDLDRSDDDSDASSD